MRAVSMRVAGKLLEDDGRFVLLLTDSAPAKDAADLLYVRLALIIRGPEEHVFPTFVLDDWGNEIRGRKLYAWLRENGDRFPRAELFGYEQDGSDAQLFVRALELYARYPLYVYPDRDVGVELGVRVSGVLLPTSAETEPVRLKRPSVAQVQAPLRNAWVKWWQVGVSAESFDWQALNAAPHEATGPDDS